MSTLEAQADLDEGGSQAEQDQMQEDRADSEDPAALQKDWLKTELLTAHGEGELQGDFLDGWRCVPSSRRNGWTYVSPTNVKWMRSVKDVAEWLELQGCPPRDHKSHGRCPTRSGRCYIPPATAGAAPDPPAASTSVPSSDAQTAPLPSRRAKVSTAKLAALQEYAGFTLECGRGDKMTLGTLHTQHLGKDRLMVLCNCIACAAAGPEAICDPILFVTHAGQDATHWSQVLRVLPAEPGPARTIFDIWQSKAAGTTRTPKTRPAREDAANGDAGASGSGSAPCPKRARQASAPDPAVTLPTSPPRASPPPPPPPSPPPLSPTRSASASPTTAQDGPQVDAAQARTAPGLSSPRQDGARPPHNAAEDAVMMEGDPALSEAAQARATGADGDEADDDAGAGAADFESGDVAVETPPAACERGAGGSASATGPHPSPAAHASTATADREPGQDEAAAHPRGTDTHMADVHLGDHRTDEAQSAEQSAAAMTGSGAGQGSMGELGSLAVEAGGPSSQLQAEEGAADAAPVDAPSPEQAAHAETAAARGVHHAARMLAEVVKDWDALEQQYVVAKAEYVTVLGGSLPRSGAVAIESAKVRLAAARANLASAFRSSSVSVEMVDLACTRLQQRSVRAEGVVGEGGASQASVAATQAVRDALRAIDGGGSDAAAQVAAARVMVEAAVVASALHAAAAHALWHSLVCGEA